MSKVAVIIVNTPENYPHVKIWRDYTTHKISNMQCRKQNLKKCNLNKCPLEEQYEKSGPLWDMFCSQGVLP